MVNIRCIDFLKKVKEIIWRDKTLYIGRFVIEADETYGKVMSMFMGHDVHVNFKPDPVHPKAEIVIGPFTRNILDQWVDRIRGTGCKFRLFVGEWEKVKNKNYFL